MTSHLPIATAGETRTANLLLFALGGAALFCLLFLPQYLYLGVNPADWRFYLGPALLGAVVGWAAGRYHLRLSLLERRLKPRGFLPLCTHCKKVRPESGVHDTYNWQEIDRHLEQEIGISVSHGICPDCAETHYGQPGQRQISLWPPNP